MTYAAVGEREVDLPDLIKEYWLGLVGAAGTGWGGWIKLSDWRAKRKREQIEASAAEQVARLDLTRFAQEAAAFAVKTLSDQVDRQAIRLTDQDDLIRSLNIKVNEVLEEYARMVGLKDAELALSRGRIRELEAEVSTLKRALEHHGVPIPLMFKAYEVIGHEVKTMGAGDDAAG